jgi:hypothetical protein
MNDNTPLRWERPALASGPIFALLQVLATVFFITVVLPHLPPLDAPPALHAQFYTEYAQQNAQVAYLYLLPVPFFLVFLGGLVARLRRMEGQGALTLIAAAAGVAFSTIWPLGIVVASAGQGMAQRGLDPLTVMTFDGVAQLALAFSGLPRAVLLLATALVLLRSRRRAFGITGMVLAALSAVQSLTLLVPEVYALAALGSLLFTLWIGALGGMLLRRDAVAQRAATPRLAVAEPVAS